MGGIQHKWTEERLEFVRNNYRKMSTLEMTNHLGITKMSLYHKARELKLTKNYPIYWDTLKEEELRKLFLVMTNKELANHFGVSITYIQSKLRELKLTCKKYKNWSKDDLKYIDANKNIMTDTELASILGVKRATLSSTRHRNFISKDHSAIRKRMFREGIIINANLGKKQSKERRDKIIKTMNERGRYKEFSERMKNGGAIKARMGNKMKPNNPEKLVMEIIKKHNLPFVYTGDGKTWIENYNPDFVSQDGSKKIIEVNGEYWHNLPKVKERDIIKTGIYKKLGYDILVISDKEILNSPESAVIKLKEFSA